MGVKGLGSKAASRAAVGVLLLASAGCGEGAVGPASGSSGTSMGTVPSATPTDNNSNAASGSNIEPPPPPQGSTEPVDDAGDAGVIAAEPAEASVVDAPAGGALEDTSGWTLTWSDEFDGPDGSAADPTKWANDVGGSGEGNMELEYYTPGAQNAVVEGGNLVITATTDGASKQSCWYGQCQYTSGRLTTRGKFSQKYGRFEARILSPSGQGMWPAFWTLGVSGGWPACGEMDIMESIDLVTANHGSLHAPNYNPTATYNPTPGLAEAFHTYAVEWDESSISFLVDDHVYETRTPTDAAQSGGTWAFTQPNYIIVNLAVGGNWPGNPNGSTTFPQKMLIDWVRVYSKN